MNSTNKDPLHEVYAGRIDENLFTVFLSSYGDYWNRCHNEGTIDCNVLYQAESNMIRYARSKGLHLEWDETKEELTAADSMPNKDRPSEQATAWHAPAYFQVAEFFEQAVDTIKKSLTDHGDEAEGLHEWLANAEKLVRGSRRMIRARQVLVACFEFDLPDRMGRIEEILHYYRNLWEYAERVNPERDEQEPCAIEIDFVEFIPDWESDYPYDTDRYMSDTADHGWKMLDLLQEHNVVTLTGTSSVNLLLTLNEPDDWCKFKTDVVIG